MGDHGIPTRQDSCQSQRDQAHIQGLQDYFTASYVCNDTKEDVGVICERVFELTVKTISNIAVIEHMYEINPRLVKKYFLSLFIRDISRFCELTSVEVTYATYVTGVTDTKYAIRMLKTGGGLTRDEMQALFTELQFVASLWPNYFRLLCSSAQFDDTVGGVDASNYVDTNDYDDQGNDQEEDELEEGQAQLTAKITTNICSVVMTEIESDTVQAEDIADF